MRPVSPSRTSQKFANPGSYASDSDAHGRAGHHTGTDYGSAWPIPIAGKRVRTIIPGEVVISDYNSTMGNWVGVYNHEHDLLVTYWHMSSKAVKVGEWVQVFQVVGRVGSTGNSTAPHMHMQVNRGRSFDYDGHIAPRHATKLYRRSAARKLHKKSPRHPRA